MAGLPSHIRIKTIILGLLFSVSTLLGTWSSVPAAWAQERLFVSNYNGHNVTAYPVTANGDVPPSLTIWTEFLAGPHHTAINHGGREVVVSNTNSGTITVYDYDTGALKRTIAGDLTRLNRPTGVAVDERNLELYVANENGDTVVVYELSADGNRAPLRVIEGPNTGLVGPIGVALDLEHNEIIVTNQYRGSIGGSITVFPRTVTGNVFPIRTILGTNTGLEKPQGVALDLVHNEILVANSDYTVPDGGAIFVFTRTDTGNQAPMRTLTGSATGVCNPMTLALDLTNNELFVANADFAGGSCVESVATYARTASGNTAPLRIISGSNSSLHNPTGVSFTVPAPTVGPVTGPTSPQPTGTPVFISAAFTDTIVTRHTCTLNWGDGTETAGAVTENGPTNNSGSCTGSHTYSTTGVRSVLVTVSNGKPGSASSAPFTVVAANTAPAITSVSVSPTTINENGSTTLSSTFTDPNSADTHTATINWGDGSSTTLNLAAGILNVSASHQYLDDNPTATSSDIYTVSIVVTDSHGASSAPGSANLTVNNVAPVITSVSPATSTAAINATVAIQANFTDAGTLDTHSCSIAWGDGQTTAGTVSEAAKTCNGTHVYTSAGTRNGVVTLNDDDSGSVASAFTVIVAAGAPSTRILFSSLRDGNAEIYSMNSDGSGVTRLTNHSSADLFPVWSPDKTKIAFTSTRSGDVDVYVMNANGTGVTQLTANCKVDGKPVWSPDGQKLALTSNRDGNFEIYVMNANGSGQTRLTNSSTADSGPAWSPDGSKIAFTSNRTGDFEIYVMNANGSGQTRLTTSSRADVDPDWSPDGSKIAFTSNRDALLNFEIYVMNANGSGVTRLTTSSTLDSGPSWSPSGAQIAFTSNRDGDTEIHVMNANGSNVVKLTNNSTADTSPDW